MPKLRHKLHAVNNLELWQLTHALPIKSARKQMQPHSTNRHNVKLLKTQSRVRGRSNRQTASVTL